ncbi:unnamed protein product [Linum tenue]|uniref:Plastid lipid-associated protein/fibrillin conserved domain-containing protein n=1 Tax=Linum tenue TaxID=586396 RepID=A0AAV0LZI2_9ROSI|nr:unnamed protein product [Linum tenue]
MAAVTGALGALRLNPTNAATFHAEPPRLCSFNSQGHRRKPCRNVRCQSSLTNQQQQQKDIPLFSEPENRLIDALIGIQGRGKSASPQQLNEVEQAVRVLEGLEGLPDPTELELIEGRWQLMFTTRPGTASPIQRTFVGVDFFKVFQEVYLRTDDPRVSNVVVFSDAVGELKVEAAASIANGKRILFQFDKAAFSLKFLPFKVPYPVPFRLLGDEAKGWLDTTYLSPSGNLRISRGNKVKITTTIGLDILQHLNCVFMQAMEIAGHHAIEEFLRANDNVGQSEQELVEGEWQMVWSSQTETDSWIENAANGLMGKQIVKSNGQLKFVVDMLLGLKFSMSGTFEKSSSSSSSSTYSVIMDDAAIIGGAFGYPIELQTKMDFELLYTDSKVRISRGYNRILFVHVRVDGTTVQK